MQDPSREPITLTIPRAVEASGLGRTKIYELISSGDLKSTTVGTRRLVDYASLKALLTSKGGENA